MKPQKEIQTPLICKNKKKNENQSVINFKDTTLILSFVCAILTNYILMKNIFSSCEKGLPSILVCGFTISTITYVINLICKKLVYIGRKH